MTDSEELKIVIRAVDEASKVLKDVKKQLGGTSGEVQKYANDAKKAAAGSSELHKEWQKLFSASKYLEEGLQDLRRTMTNLLWSNVALAISSVVMQITAYAIEAIKTKVNTEELTGAIEDQARGWGLLPDKMKSVTEATVNLYNAQLGQLQLLRKDEGETFKKQIKELEEWIALQREVVKNAGKFPWPLDKSVVQGISAAKTELEEAQQKLKDWQSLMKLTPTSLSEISANLNKMAKDVGDIKVDDSILKQISDLELQIVRLRDGEDSYLFALKDRLILQGIDADQIDRLIAKMRELHTLQVLSQIKPLSQEPEFFINPPAGTAITKDEFESLNRRNELMNEYNRLQNDTIFGMNDRIVAAAALQEITIDEMQQMLLSNEAIKVQNALYQAGVSAVAQAILGQQQLGKALKAALAQTLAQIAAESAIQTIFETAKGFAALYINPPAAAAHFKAAATFAATAAVAGIAARTASRGVDKGAYSSSGSTGSTSLLTSRQSQPSPQNVQIIVHGSIVDHAAFVRELQPYFKEVKVDTV